MIMSRDKIKSITDNNLSFYRTLHHFKRYGEFSNLEQFRDYVSWAKSNTIKIYVLGNGSNTLFTRKDIKSLILKNKLSKHINSLPEYRLEVSSSVLLIDVLKYCYENSFDSFYYLASVPATLGGALAMNAGRAKHHHRTIYDFVESVTFFDVERDCIRTLGKEEIVIGHRQTIFTGIHSCLILSAILKFSPISMEGNPITERCKWSKKFQDNSEPNCGSVFKESESKILKQLQGMRIGKACFSAKTTNWILNSSDSSIPILLLIAFAKFLHFLNIKKAILEVILVD